jgi:hypothetical protein
MSEGIIKERKGKKKSAADNYEREPCGRDGTASRSQNLVVDGNTGRFLYMEVEVDQVISAVFT